MPSRTLSNRASVERVHVILVTSLGFDVSTVHTA